MFTVEDISVLSYQEAALFRNSIRRVLAKRDFQHARMNNGQENRTDTSLDFKFSRDLIRFVMHDLMLGLHWKPIGLFVEQDSDSPFTSQFKNAIKNCLESNGHDLYEIYDENYTDKSKVEEVHKENAIAIKDAFLTSEYHPETFIKFCTLSGVAAGLSYLYGARIAPFQSLLATIRALKELKNMKKFDNFWNEIQDWLESREKERRKTKLLQKRFIDHFKCYEE